MIKPVLSTDGQVAFTTPAQPASTPTRGRRRQRPRTEDMIVVTDYPENLDQVRNVLKEIDRRPQQILVEAVILRATLRTTTPWASTSPSSAASTSTRLTGTSADSIGDASGATLTRHRPASAARSSRTAPPAAVNDNGFVAGSVGGSGLKLGFVNEQRRPSSSPALEGVTDTVVHGQPQGPGAEQAEGRSASSAARTATARPSRPRPLTADDVEVPRDRHAPDLPPVHRRRRLHPHGDPPGRLQRLGQRPGPAVQDHRPK